MRFKAVVVVSEHGYAGVINSARLHQDIELPFPPAHGDELEIGDGFYVVQKLVFRENAGVEIHVKDDYYPPKDDFEEILGELVHDNGWVLDGSTVSRNDKEAR